MPLPVFVGYRIIWFLYILAWLIAAILVRTDIEGVRWLIYLTNQSYILLVLGSGAITILTVGYAIAYLIDKRKLQSFYPQSATTLQVTYKQDNIPWYVKICWLLYIMGAAAAIVVVVGFWSVIYDPNCEPLMSPNSTVSCITIDVYSVHVHLINGILVILDLYLSRIPIQLLHIFYPAMFTLWWVIFSVVFFAAGGTNPFDGGPYIYEVLDYGNSPALSGGFAILIVISPFIGFILLFVLGWTRDVIYKKIPCCYRELQNDRLDHQESSQALEVV